MSSEVWLLEVVERNGMAITGTWPGGSLSPADRRLVPPIPYSGLIHTIYVSHVQVGNGVAHRLPGADRHIQLDEPIPKGGYTAYKIFFYFFYL